MPTSSTIQLVVEDFGGDASAVTTLMGLEPSAVALPDAAAGGAAGKASWIFEIAMPETESVEGQALALLRFLESHHDPIQQAVARYPASIAIAVGERGPKASAQMSLIPMIAAEVSRLGLGIRIHFSYED
jgi:uncharacterized protein DUF4279